MKPRAHGYAGQDDGPAGLRADLEEAWTEVNGPEPDDIDNAIRALTESRRVLKDERLMRAVRERLDEQRQAVEAAGGKE